MTTKEQIASFSNYALHEIDNGGAAMTIDELYTRWRSSHPTDIELAESVAALEEAWAELESGQTGRPAREMLRESCERLGLDIDE